MGKIHEPCIHIYNPKSIINMTFIKYLSEASITVAIHSDLSGKRLVIILNKTVPIK